jgi:glycosyltransferase involved in cell wall biosynthesis
MREAARRGKPELSFLIVARNAERHLPTLFQNYLEQTYPMSQREFIFVDSMSKDGTRRIAEKFAQDHPDIAMVILENPKLSLAAGWNVALKAAQGDIVVRIDAHVSIPPHYLSEGVRVLKEHIKNGVMCVGGPWTTKGEGFWGQAIAGVLSSPFGVGNSPFRHGNREGFSETVPGGIYWRRVFDVVGPYREDVGRAEDNEMHNRIRAQGWKFYLSPKLRNTYHCRNTIPAFLKQAWGNGYWLMKFWRVASLRHMVPMAFVGALVILGLGGLIWEPLGQGLRLLLLIYAASALLAAFMSEVSIGRWRLLALPPLFFLLHITYGLGSWWAWLSRLRGKS